jgi:hypothetical protein
VVRGACGKRVSADLTRRVAKAVNLREDYFMEARIAFVVEHLSDDPSSSTGSTTSCAIRTELESVRQHSVHALLGLEGL